MLQSTRPPAFLGIDVAKNKLDLCLLAADGRHLRRLRLANKPAAVAGFAASLDHPVLAVLEASGGYEAAAAEALEAAGVSVHIANPQRTFHFSRSLGRLEKTDRLDAAMLARYAAERRPRPRQPPHPSLRRLSEIAVRRRQLLELRTAERNRLAQSVDAFVQQTSHAVIDCLNRQIEACERQIDALKTAAPELDETARLLASVPGVGPTTTHELLAWLPELGRLNRQEIAKLVGLAPLVRQSGRWQGQARTGGGRKRVRSTLYMAALAASRSAVFRGVYLDLIGRGKAPKVALTALAHRLLGILNQMLKQRRPFEPALLARAAG